MKRFMLVLVGAIVLASAAPASATLVPVRMTGGGWVEGVVVGGFKEVDLAFELQCQLGDAPNNLLLTDRAGGFKGTFDLKTVTSAFCAPNDPNDPQAGGIHRGTGRGICNGLPAGASWTFVDAGVAIPHFIGAIDSVSITVASSSPPCNFSVSGPLGGGNLLMLFVVID